ncbi:MAG: response regulator transcription factor [Deltaproteobacteria bacterium]|nr:response regulator transcription factor [Deltaproteobacteria bacterium]
MPRIKVLIADDHAVVREGLKQIFEDQPDMVITCEAEDGLEAVEKVRTLQPDVAVVDLAMPRLGGLDAIGLIKEVAPDIKVVVLSMHSKETYVHQTLAAGALGYVLKASPMSDVLEAVRAAYRGEYFLSSKIRAEVVGVYLKSHVDPPTPKGYDLLSEREQQVFRMVVEGNSTNQIADVLCLSPKTVEKHRANIMKKLGLRDRLEMVKFAVKIGLVDPELWED